MSTLTLTSIQVTADFAIKLPAAPHEVLAPVGQVTEILNRQPTPFAFRLPAPCPANQTFGFNIAGRLTISEADLSLWSTAGARYRVKAGPDAAHPVMQSDALPVGIVVGHTLNIATGAFHLLQIPQVELPFKCVENWIWSVVLEIGNAPRATLSNALTTHMKAYFLLGAPPATVGQAYPLDLLEYFIPQFSMLPQVALSLPDSLKWWAKSVVAKVFAHANANLRYAQCVHKLLSTLEYDSRVL